MEEDEYFIRENITALFSSQKVKAKMGELGGEWKLHEIGSIHGTPRNIEFSATYSNGSDCLNVLAKINRQTAKLSITEILEI